MSTLSSIPETEPPPSAFTRYRPAEGVYDEMAGPSSGPREHWLPFLESAQRLVADEWFARGEGVRRTLREQGVTYNVYGDAQGLERLWELDLMPMLLPPAEWKQIEQGLIQRTRLLNLILADFYGQRRLLREGALPTAMLLANPSFLRPCHGIRPPRGIHLFLHAVDLARSPDGQWWVLADRTQAPSGAGYALVNRIILSRILPEEFRGCHAQRLAPFFQVARDTLRSLAPQNKDQPNVVLLTPGPYNETYFEHAFLARYLGFPLVEGGDLTVRDCRVFIKTLEGLQPVDVILRRVDDTFCDPLELRAESYLGVPGLVEAVRAGSVAVANSLGSGAVETPAMMPFLPGLSRLLLGEELKLPSVATWWCGQPEEFSYVRDHLDELVLKRAFPSASGEPVFGLKLDERKKRAVVAEMRSSPNQFVGQEQVALSTAPVWVDGRLESRPMVLRAYICAAGDSYVVLRGGLTRVSGSPHDPVVSMQSGGGSKDTWVAAEGDVSALTLLPPPTRIVRPERTAAEVPSRVADNLFWLGRYAERLESTIRPLRSLVTRLTGELGAEEIPERAALVEMLVWLDLLPSGFRAGVSQTELERELLLSIYQPQRLGSVREVLNRLRQIASSVRERFSSDTWRIFNKLQLDARSRPGRLPMAEALTLLNTLLADLAAFSGMEMENMTRGHGWRFLAIGRRLERSVSLVGLLRASLLVRDGGGAVLEPVLEIADSVMTYRRCYFASPQLGSVLDLLLADETNPRALAFQLNALADHIAHLPYDPVVRLPDRAAEHLAAVNELLRETGIKALVHGPRDMDIIQIKSALESMSAHILALSDTLTHHYFSHVGTQVS